MVGYGRHSVALERRSGAHPVHTRMATSYWSTLQARRAVKPREDRPALRLRSDECAVVCGRAHAADVITPYLPPDLHVIATRR